MKTKSRKDPRKVPDINIMFNKNSQTYMAHHDWYLKSYPNDYIELKNSIFYDQLIYEGYVRTNGGNSHMIFKSAKNGHIYHMFMSDFHEVILNNRMIDREIIGEFTFTKKSHSVCVRLIIDEPPP